ncbi:hypothetical protein GALMADRAFT_53006 [Galerina marginata CBS 339.88]|uniref:Uncharacterized protein n=1 Tax=Galerina marginata (strain CBS 339.88) TaxID=685588 RepID=A0A067TZ96_GALM3|nr:hypothetical protein GALMADRAFT_53006 [Galerina marginata CBS 339.88]
MNSNGHHAAMNGYPASSVASTSSNNFNDFLPQHLNQPLFNNNIPQQIHHQHPSQPMQHRNPHNQWQDHAMQMNAPQTNGLPTNQMPQHQPPFNQGSWGNQMHSQQFPNNIPPMAPFNMSFLPQQLIQEAYAMSAPVEGSDEPILLTKLLSAARRKESYKDALNSLHGKNGHSASLWKDYYLDHRERLDGWITMCLQKEQEGDRSSTGARGFQRSASSDVDRVKSIPTIKKPSPASFKREPSPHASYSRVSISAPSIKRPQRKSDQSTPPLGKDQGRRNTINSLTAPSPVYGGRLPAPNAEIKIPDPPSRSPSPPTNVIPHRGRGNKYTKEDRDFFIKFVGWRLKQDPALSRLDICNLLADKAPHHTAQSWASHWSNNHDIPDKILAAARGDEYISDGASSSEEAEEEEKAPTRRRPKYKDPSTTEESDNSESDVEKGEPAYDDDDDKPLRHYAEKDMGDSGSPFTDADLYVTAKYIAASQNWEDTTSKDRWEPHHQKHPQRSAKSWAEYYRRNEHSLMKLANKIKKEGTNPSYSSGSSIHTQCARPTRTPPKAKRKLEPGSGDDSFVKRGRAE